MSDNNDNSSVTIERIFDAPVSRVWQAWTDPEQLEKWWGPKDFTAPHINLDFRVGGKYLYAMHGPAGSEFDVDMWSTGTVEEIVPLKKIVFTDNFADAEGNVIPAAAYGMQGNWPDHLVVTIEFEDLGDKTKLTLTHTGAPDQDQAHDMETGWNQSLDKLAESLVV